MGGPKNWFGFFGDGGNLVPLPGLEPQYFGFPVRIVVTMPNTLYPPIMRYTNSGLNWRTVNPNIFQFRVFMYLHLHVMCWSHIGGRNGRCSTKTPFWSQLNVSVLRSGIWRCNNIRHSECKILNVCIIFLCAFNLAVCYTKPPSICATSKMWYALLGKFCVALHKIVMYSIDRNNCVTSCHNCGYIFHPVTWSSSGHSCT